LTVIADPLLKWYLLILLFHLLLAVLVYPRDRWGTVVVGCMGKAAVEEGASARRAAATADAGDTMCGIATLLKVLAKTHPMLDLGRGSLREIDGKLLLRRCRKSRAGVNI
jgi:hypothetical protein